MNNFSKFLDTSEELKMIFDSKKNSVKIYFVIVLFLLMFFILVPMLKNGVPGLIAWFFLILYLLFSLANTIGDQNNWYLLTNKRLIHVKMIAKNNYKLLGFIKLADIQNVYKNKKTIQIIYKHKKYHLRGIILADKLYEKLNSYIKS